MYDNKRGGYKYCIVPKCSNTSIKTPEKLFFSVPKDVKKRERWCKAMKRSQKVHGKYSSKSTLFCCEDHFSLQDDMKNYWQFKLTKVVTLQLKEEVVPHIFHCQLDGKPKPERKLPLKRQRMALIQEALNDYESRYDVRACADDKGSTKVKVTKEEKVSAKKQEDKNKKVCNQPSLRNEVASVTAMPLGLDNPGTYDFQTLASFSKILIPIYTFNSLAHFKEIKSDHNFSILKTKLSPYESLQVSLDPNICNLVQNHVQDSQESSNNVIETSIVKVEPESDDEVSNLNGFVLSDSSNDVCFSPNVGNLEIVIKKEESDSS